MDLENDVVQKKISELETLAQTQNSQIEQLKQLVEKCVTRIDSLESGTTGRSKTPNMLNLDSPKRTTTRDLKSKPSATSPRVQMRPMRNSTAGTRRSTPDLLKKSKRKKKKFSLPWKPPGSAADNLDYPIYYGNDYIASWYNNKVAKGSSLENHKELTFNKGDGSIRIFLRGRPVNLYVPSALADNLDVKTSLPVPDENLKMDWVYGYRGRDCRKNVYYQSSSGDLVYFVAGVAVLHNLAKEEQRHYTEHNDDIKCMAMHPDKITFATGQVASHSKLEGKPHVRVWSSITLQTLHIIGIGHFDRAVAVVAFSKLDNGAHLCTVDEANDHNISVWDWSKKKLLCTSKSSTEAVIDAEFDPKDNNMIVSSGKNHLVFWQIKSGALVKKTAIYEKFEKPKIVTCVTFTPEGDVVTGDSSGNIFIWSKDKRGVKEAITGAHEGPVFCLQMLADGSALVSGGGKDRLLQHWDLGTKTSIAERRVELSKESGCPRAIWETDEAGTLVVGTTNNGLLQLPAGSTEPQTILAGHFDEVWALASHPSAPLFLTGGFDHRLLLWNSEQHMVLAARHMDFRVQSAAFCPVGSLVMVTGTEGQWALCDPASSDTPITDSGKDSIEPMQCCEFNHDGSQVAIGSRDNAIYLYKVDQAAGTLTRSAKCSGHSSFVTHLDWSNDGQYLRSNSGDYELLFWNAEEGKQVTGSSALADIEWASCNCTLAFETAGIWPEGSDGTDINAVTKAHQKPLLATADDFGKVNLYRYPACASKSSHKSKNGHSSHVTGVRFLCDDQTLLSCGGQDTAIIQWSVT